MDCTAIRIAAVSGVDPWILTIVIVKTLSMFFQLFCAYPVFKLSRERFALYILVSKLFPAIFGLLASIIQRAAAYVHPSNITGFFVTYIVIPCAIFCSISNRLHIIALATNRAHAVFFPFHYKQKMTKRLIFVQCLFMHLLSIPITFYLYNFKTPAYYTGSYVIVSSLFYAAIVTKFAWIKAHNRNWGTEVAASASDKDSVRLTLTCVAIQIVAMCQMSYISANMRTNCRQLLGKVWPFTTTNAAIDAGLNTQIRNINVNVVGSNSLAAQQLGQPNK
uniref:Serpentine receptor class gamma n=1 Tax=Globodera rostochiensis TaxID=31243 RepID=A0A914H6X7_GLORO